MKKFLHKRWLSIPIMVVLVLALTAGAVFAAYPFLGFTTEIEVDEPLTVEMAWWNYNENVWTDFWVVSGGGDELTLQMSPAEVQTLKVRLYNISYGELTVHTLFSGQVKYFTFDGWPNGVVPGSNGDNSLHEWEGVVTITASGETPPAFYNVNVEFTRE